jgi:hypothetical protein
MGLTSNADKEEEEMLLNPSKIEEIMLKKAEKKELKRQELLNENNRDEKDRKRYEVGERSIHHQIPPARDRVEEYKRKGLQKWQQFD